MTTTTTTTTTTRITNAAATAMRVMRADDVQSPVEPA